VQDVVTAVNVGETTIIDGFTITKGDWSGIWCDVNSSPTIANNTIKENNYDGIDCNENSGSTIIDCTIEDNGKYGICCLPDSSPTITRSRIQNNGDDGIYYEEIGEGIKINIRNNWIHNNGDGIYIYNTLVEPTPAVIRNNTIVNNAGYGINSLYAQDVNITNCIIWDNGDDPNDNLYADDNATFDVNYSCVEYDTNYTGTGNINGDPCFVDDVNDDYHLTWNSPCVDWGDPNFVADANETDIDGNPRVMGGRVDMGGDEDYPHCDLQYDDWVTLGRPNCWMWPYQCDGDADGINSGAPYYYRVYTGDMALIIQNWKKKAGDQTLNACADIDHISSGEPYYYRVYTGDIGKVIANWRKKPGTPPTGLAGDCVSRGCQRGALGGGSLGTELSSKELLTRLAEIWLDPEVQKTIDEEKFLKVYESLKELSNQ